MTLLERTEHNFAATSRLTNYDFKFITSEYHFDDKANVTGYVSNMFSKSLGKKKKKNWKVILNCKGQTSHSKQYEFPRNSERLHGVSTL